MSDDFMSDRVVTSIPAPPHLPLDSKKLWAKPNVPDVAALQEHFLAEGKLSTADVLKIVELASAILRKEPNMVEVSSPITVAGDTHGQYYDFVTLLGVGGDPKDTTYLFLGDYVDRGCFSIEIVLHLYCLKLLHPKSLFMLRGNHECRHLTDYFTFKTECEHKYDTAVYDAIMDSFDSLPIAALLNEQFLCVHGGLSPEIDTLDDIQEIDRFMEPPSSGPLCDLLWADPMEDFDDDAVDEFQYNEVRGCSYMYSFKAVCDFLERNQLLSLVRAHEAQDAGYRMHRKNDATGFPSVITIFSAPNYLDAYGNKAAVLRYDNNVMNIRQFNASPHPYYLPNFMNVFTWSVPFVVEKLADILLAVLNLPDPPAEGGESAEEAEATERRRREILNKVRAVSKMRKMMHVLREEEDTIVALKQLAPNGRIPKGLLLKGSGALKEALGNFQKAKELDTPNELRPDVDHDDLRKHSLHKRREGKQRGASRSRKERSKDKKMKAPAVSVGDDVVVAEQ